MSETAPLSAETLSDLVGLIYDCVLEPGRWPAALERMRAELGFFNASMSVIDLPSGRIVLNIHTGIEPHWLERMDGAETIRLWGGPERMQSYDLNEPAVLSDVNPRENWERDRYYLEWSKPQGITDLMAIGLTRTPDAIGSIGFGRHASAGEIGEREVEAARLLIPHLQRAVAISRLLDLRAVVADNHRAALDALRVGVVLVDSDLRIVHANHRAAGLLKDGDPILDRAGRLQLRSPLLTAALASAVRQAGEDEAAIGRRGFGIPVSGESGPPSVLHVLPLHRGALRPALSPVAAAAVFVAPASAARPSPGDIAASLFDLTPAETRVFSHVAEGLTPVETAERLGVAHSTVKTHLVRIFMKTDTRRQADLVRLASSLTLAV